MAAWQHRRLLFCPIRHMSSFKLPRAVSWPLTIHRGEAQLSAALAVVFDDQSLVSNDLARELLGPTEFAYFSTLPFGHRRQGYLLVRYAASWLYESYSSGQISGSSKLPVAFSISRSFYCPKARMGCNDQPYRLFSICV